MQFGKLTLLWDFFLNDTTRFILLLDSLSNYGDVLPWFIGKMVVMLGWKAPSYSTPPRSPLKEDISNIHP